ncbi:uncharacterized protein LOC133188110 [Saccostrea echinata]|uniref:uncharacterized protein LOC133188110 n=1 Tax=Saccostrea echinata TaxID=191078 RepID=UPI002A7ED841|nr:uncharacterized protein LOC133188110 [Saccostrea echinata]
MIEKQVETAYKEVVLCTGSYREGFRFEGSDVDAMFWPKNIRVIWNFSQARFYSKHDPLILSDDSESPPGFTLLWLPTNHVMTIPIVISATVRIKNRLYISSSLYREIMPLNTSTPKNSISLGPCNSYNIGELEVDIAHCFASNLWPPSALPWIDRCTTWPRPEVLRDIVSNGCHFVAIGHKLGNHEDDEWRISFSLAEQKPVYSMDHCQFLIYGLLKIFLKEVINNDESDEGKLLCSYHMKTAVFWAIQQNYLIYCSPQNLLKCFWICFKFLLKWVYEGICPNFFIPQNNMFLTNIYGQAQKNLFHKLYALYQMGLSCLLSSSVGPSILLAISNSELTLHTIITEVEFDIAVFIQTSNVSHFIGESEIHLCLETIYRIEQSLCQRLNQCQVVMLQKYTASLLQHSAFIVANMYTGVNKLSYSADKKTCHMLKLAAKFGFISDMVYIAMYYYRTKRYKEALRTIKITKDRLAQPHLICNANVATKGYTEVVRGYSMSKKMRYAVRGPCRVQVDIYYINELLLEQQSALQNGVRALAIPLPVLLQMLEFLIYRHVDTAKTEETLKDLHVLVHHDEGVYIPKSLRGISWQIFGICQEMMGDCQSALYSYQQSLTDSFQPEIHSATLARLHDLNQKPVRTKQTA